MNRRRRVGPVSSLPVFPWDTLADATALAKSHPDGIVDLSVGTPVDPVAPLIREALAAASAAPGYPTTAGTPELRQSAVAALERRHGVTGVAEAAVLPVIGTKELIAWLPTLLGPGRRGSGRGARAGLSDLRRRRPAGRNPGAATPIR